MSSRIKKDRRAANLVQKIVNTPTIWKHLTTDAICELHAIARAYETTHGKAKRKTLHGQPETYP